MIDATGWIAIVGSGLVGLALVTFAALRAWHDWLEVRRLEIGAGAPAPAGPPTAAARIELADLRERVRKLEAIAAGIEL